MSQNLSFIQISENEYRIGENRIRIIDNSIVYIDVIGEQTIEHAALIKQNFKKVTTGISGKIKQLVNLNLSGKSSPEARAMFKDMNDENISEKVAIFGIHPVASVLAKFVTGITHQKNIRYFTNENEAFEWLRASE